MLDIEKNINSKEGQKSLVKETRQELQQMILDLTEKKATERFSDENLDRENEKIKLLNGSEVSISSIKEFISKTLSPHRTLFPLEFYQEVYRLNQWELDPKDYVKPPVVGKWTNELIYSRFPKEILQKLQALNPYIKKGVRQNKHFQWLNDEGKELVSEYINDAIRIMKKCSDWYEFRIQYFKEYGIGFQLNAFQENNF